MRLYPLFFLLVPYGPEGQVIGFELMEARRRGPWAEWAESVFSRRKLSSAEAKDMMARLPEIEYLALMFSTC
jgi:hypothetical protein